MAGLLLKQKKLNNQTYPSQEVLRFFSKVKKKTTTWNQNSVNLLKRNKHLFDNYVARAPCRQNMHSFAVLTKMFQGIQRPRLQKRSLLQSTGM